MDQALSFGGFVRQRRREMDLTQEELARRVGCAAITLRKIEADDLRASVQIAERLAMALAISLEERAEFVRWARSVRPQSSDLPAVTPPPSMEEIGREDLTGRAIRGYALAERIGMGGMGSVYRAVQPNVDREVAVKIILPAFANHPDFIRRFETEAQLVARLEHPHIVPLYDYWREPGVAYLVMRLLRGGNVQSLLGQGPLTVEMTTRMLEQICSALSIAHRIGVIHRDLKPANVLLDEDSNAYLADFGIAKNLGNPDIENQTQLDAIIGSPQYMSPEQIRSLSVRPQTDIYCLGVMLYEMLTGTPPFTGPTPFDFIQQHINSPMPPLSANRAGLPSELDAVIARATAKDTDVRYADSLSLFNDFRQATGRMTGAQTIVNIAYEEEEAEIEIGNPFKGLRAFNEADAENFFGRETLVQQLLARLGEGGDLSRFLAVIGPSGSGKSSVVRAGLIPALRRGGLPGSENWFIVDMLPGKHPFEELEASLLRVAVNPPQSLLSQLKDGERGLLRAVHRILPVDESVELVLVIDQFEEVFTLVEDESERALLLENLAAAVLDERSRLRVVITLRADFTDKPLRYVDFGELLNRRFEFVLPLTADEVERAVAGPAQRAGLKLEKGLVSTIIRDIGSQPGGLPLLQHALSELFEKRAGRTLTNRAYREIGGVLGALGRSAESVHADLDETSRSIARQLFLRLITLGEGTEDTRRRVLRAELENLGTDRNRLSAVLDAFGKARLLSFDRDPVTRGATVEVAHEALLREWTRLREWLDESRGDVRIQRQLAAAAGEWQLADCDPSFLMTGSRLEQFEGWAAGTTVALTQDERALLEASIQERNRREAEEHSRQQRELEAAQKLAQTEHARAVEQTQSANRLRTRNRVITTVGSVALILALVAGMFGAQSNQNAEQAQTNLGIANEQRAAAVNAQSTAIFDAQSLATQQVIAESNFDRAEAQRLALEANRLLLTEGSAEQIALLSLQSMKLHYTPEGDAALAAAARLEYPVQVFNVGAPTPGVAYSPDGKYILTSSGDKIVRLWDSVTGEDVRQFMGHSDQVESVAFSPDGEFILTGSVDKTARLWDTTTGKEVRQFIHPALVNSVAFSPDGKSILTGGGDKIARLWDMASGQVVRQFVGHTEPVDTVAFSPDGKYILTGSVDKTARLWNAASGQEVHQFVGQLGGVVAAISPDGKQVATGSDDQTMRIWDAQTGQELHELSGHTNPVTSVAFSPDGRYLVSTSDDATARLWDVQTGQEVRRFHALSHAFKSAAFSPDSKYVVTGGSDGTTLLWSVTPLHEPDVFEHTAGVNGVAVSRDGKLALTGGNDGIARLWNTSTGQKLYDLVGHTGVINYGVAFSPDRRYILTGSWDKTVRLWDAATGRQVYALTTGEGVNSVTFSPDGRYILAGSNDTNAWLWLAETGELVRQFPAVARVNRAVFSPDGKLIATASPNGGQLWEVATGRELLKFGSGRISGVMFSPDGKYILSSNIDSYSRLFDVATGREVRKFVGHRDVVWTAAFSPDGNYIATASADGTGRLWEAATGKEIRRFTGHAAGLENITFLPDGKHILTGSDDGTAMLWDVDYHTTMEYLCSRLLRDFTEEERSQFGIADHSPTCPSKS